MARVVAGAEVATKARRQRFTAKYKRRLLAAADSCTKASVLGPLLRREVKRLRRGGGRAAAQDQRRPRRRKAHVPTYEERVTLASHARVREPWASEKILVNWATWLGMALCLSQSAMFSGLNLGMLGPSRLRLQVAAKGGDWGAQRILALRKDFHLLLTTILWGNVAVNTLLALLADSILTGIVAFAVSTVSITLFGEIVPQGYVSRHAYVVGGTLAPLIRLYRAILLPVAWPTARLLDKLVGKERLGLFREGDLREMLELHIRDDTSELSHVEGQGALNFLALDDRHLEEEAEPLHPNSILSFPFTEGRAQFPIFQAAGPDRFLHAIHRSRRKWVVITDEWNRPRLVLNANAFLRSALMDLAPVNPAHFCHEPLLVSDPKTKLEGVLTNLQLRSRQPGGKPLHPDVVLLWTAHDKRVLTGVDLLENLLRGIATEGRH